MSDPQLEMDVDGQPVDADAVVAGPEPEAWLVKPSDPRWQVWRDHNRRRPPTRAEKRGRIAAATAGTIIGVLGVVGAATYAMQWQGLQQDANDQVQLGGGTQGLPLLVADELEGGADIQVALDRAERANRGSSGLIAIENGDVTATTVNVGGTAADQGFISEVAKQGEGATEYWVLDGTYSSRTSASVYTVTQIPWNDRTIIVVNVVDLTAARNRMNSGYLAYGLIGLGLAGAAGGTVWWRLGRQLKNKKVEPEDV